MPTPRFDVRTYLILGIVLTAVTLLTGCCGNPDNDVIIAKLSPSGQHEWTKEFNCGGHTLIYAAAPTADSGCIFSAMMNDTPPLQCLNKDGVELWSGYGGGEALVQGQTGNIFSFRDDDGLMWIHTPSGTLIHNRTVPELVRPSGDAYSQYPPSVIATSDGGYAACGAFGVVKLDAHGNVTVTGPTPRDGTFTSLVERDDGDFLVTSNYRGLVSLWHIHNGKTVDEPVQVDPQNETYISQNFLHKDAHGYLLCYNRQYTPIPNVTATTPSGASDADPTWICERVSGEGAELGPWHKIITTSAPLVVSHDGGFFTAESCFLDAKNTTRGIRAVKLDSSGIPHWESTIPISLDWGIKKIIPTTDGGFVIIGLRQHKHAMGGR